MRLEAGAPAQLHQVAAGARALVAQSGPAWFAVVPGALMEDINERMFQRARPGATFAELCPAGRWLANVNGEWLSRRDWWQPLRPGDVVVFCQRPQGKSATRILLTIAVVVVAIAAPYLIGAQGAFAAFITAGVNIAGQALINSLVPLDQPGSGSQSPTYSVSVQGNTARLEQPQPVLYGHNKTFPDFASQPYSLFVYDPDSSSKAGDQYYHACLEIGLGQMEVLRVSLDDTPIQDFRDVEWIVVGPGQEVTRLADQDLVETNVVTAPEVSGQALKHAQWVGPFAATGPQQRCNRIGIDIQVPRLVEEEEMLWRAQMRPINDFEQPSGPWSDLANEVLHTHDVTPARRSYDYAVPAGRYQVRLQRIDGDEDSPEDDLMWAGLRARVVGQGVRNDDATFVVLKIRATAQLSGLSQRRINVLSNRKLPVWNGSTWSAPVVTRNPAWAATDALRNTIYGRGLSNDAIDLPTYAALAEEFDLRQDHFDFVFDTDSSTWDALAQILRVGRCVPLIRGSKYTAVRDAQQTLPVAGYTMRNIVAGSFRLSYLLPEQEQVDALDLEYYDLRRWDWVTVTAQVRPDGTLVVYRGDGNRPAGLAAPKQRVTQRLAGVIGETQAKREALYHMADTQYRRRRAMLNTELDGNLPAYGSLVTVAHDVPAWGQSGDVWAYDEGSRQVSTSEPLDWSAGGRHYVRLQRPDGSLTEPVQVAAVAGEPRAFRLPAEPDFELLPDEPDRERTRYIFGSAQAHGAACRVTALRPQSEREVEVSLVLEDDRVHTVDNALLPGPGQVQDPISDGSTNGGTFDNYVAMTSRTYQTDDGEPARFQLRNDGRLRFWGDSAERLVDGEWMSAAPVTVATAGAYEVKVHLVKRIRGIEPPSGPFDVWRSLATSPEWAVYPPDPHTNATRATGIFEVQVRHAGSHLEAGTATFTVHCFLAYVPDPGGGGGDGGGGD
jgi:Putative phage tail protein